MIGSLRKGSRLCAGVCALLAVVLFVPFMAQAQRGAMDEIELVAASALEVLRGDGTQKAKREQIERIADQHFAFATIAKLSLGRGWRDFSAAQREEYVQLFRTFLARRYGSQLDRFSGEDVAVLSERPEPRGDVTVRTELIRPTGDRVSVDYRLRLYEGEWRIIDVTIEGVSLVGSFRSQFREVLKDGGPQALLQQLREKNASVNG